MTIKAGIFDLDDTLLNRDASVKIFVEKQYDRFHKWLNHIPKISYIDRFIELDNRGYVWKDKVYQQLVNEFDIEGLTREILLEDYINQFKNCCVPFPHLISMLENLKKRNILLGIITNGKGQFQMDNIQALGIEHYFEVILISEWEGMKKPDPRIFKKALEEMNVSSYESIFIGDHPENDVKASKNIGMIGIWKKDDQWDCVQADYIVEDLMEIPSIIEKLTNA